MKRCLLFFFLILLNAPLFAQNDNAKLLVQSPDGKTVKLVWFIKSWNVAITGFDIKRKEGLDNWVKLNTAPILPGISTTKDLSEAGLDKHEESAVKAKLYKLLATHKLKENDYATLLQKLNTDEKILKELSKNNARDYDIALMSGFAYVDHSVTRKTDYQYGLFIQGTDQLLAKVSWNYGEIPDLNVVREITSRSSAKNNGVLMIWNADSIKMNAANVAGFNIYRQGIRLNNTPIQPANTKDLSEYSWYDKSAVSTIANQYSISAESIFGIEGIIRPYTYNPADHPHEYKKAEVTEVTSLGYYYKDGISLKWIFPKEQEHFLQGFYVEKNNTPDGYKRVSPLLDPSTRSFTDKTSSPVSSYVIFRVVAVYNDKTLTPGTAKIYSYFPVREPPQPQNPTANTDVGAKKVTAYLNWDPAMPGDTLTEFYRVYILDPSMNKMTLVTDQLVLTNSFAYIIQYGTSAVYKFCISAFSKNKTESSLSDTIAFRCPSLELPKPELAVSPADSNRVLIKWQYPDVYDLKGFRLFQNNVLVASEIELRKDVFEFITVPLAPGADYNFTIRAIANNGVMSDFSEPVSLTIPKPAGK